MCAAATVLNHSCLVMPHIGLILFMVGLPNGGENALIWMQGTILAFVTDFFADFLATDNVDDLVALLKKARLDDRLLEFFPPQQRSLDQFNSHFKVIPRRSTPAMCLLIAV